jgi:hypothetical protein
MTHIIQKYIYIFKILILHSIQIFKILDLDEDYNSVNTLLFVYVGVVDGAR